jgi:glycosyltransferase involved in cell wall biosynthesis
MGTPAVLHVLALHGGGVDRHVRDVLEAVPRPQVLWHVGDRAEVIEAPGKRRFMPLDPAGLEASSDRLTAWLRERGVGVVHLHAMATSARRRAEWLLGRLEVPLVTTLHDVTFLRPDAFDFDDPAPDAAWLREVSPVLHRAEALLAPSDYIAATARSTFRDVAIHVVPNGIDATPDPARPPVAARPDFLQRRPQRVVAILGAVGAHKGADLVRALPAALEGSGIGVVVIGYLDRQIYPGWAAGGGVYVHGPYHPHDARALLAAYRAELVLFPNRAPESFSYALSEAWSAGLPVLAGPRGAIGERIRRHGGGWLLGERFDAADVARELRRLLGPGGEGEVGRVRSGLDSPDPERVPTLDTMAQSLEAYYRRYGGDAATPAAQGASIDALLAPSLDPTLFRAELAHLADLCDAGGESSRRARDFETEARAWIAKLEGDVRELQAELRQEFAERTRLAGELAQLDDAAALVARLPRWMRRALAAVVRRARR